MAQAFPSTGSLALDGELLTGLALDLCNETNDYIADKLPSLGVYEPMSSNGAVFEGLIQKSEITAFFPHADKLTSIQFGQKIPMIEGARQSSIPWRAKKFAHAGTIPKEYNIIASARDISAARFSLAPVIEHVRVERELQVLSAFGTAANWGSNHTTLTYDWTDPNGDPIGDIMTAIEAVTKFGTPDTMILGAASAFALMSSQSFNGPRAMDVDRATLRADQMAELIRSRFGIERVLVSRAKYNASNVADPSSASITMMLPDVCWIGKLNGANMQSGSNFAVQSMAAARITPIDFLVESEYDVETQSVLFTASVHEAFPVLQPELGYLIENCA